MIKGKELGRRLVSYILGLFIMTLGIAISVKSNLGVSPVSSIPYTITCVFGIEMGNATILFHLFLIALQVVLLRKNFKPINLLQIAVGVMFGKFTTLCNCLMDMLPPVEGIVFRIVMMGISVVLIAVGIFFYMPADIMPLAGEGATQAVSKVTKVEFSKVKIVFDSSMVLVSLVVCLVALHGLGSVGVGTIAAAFSVGFVLGEIKKKFGAWRDRLLHIRTFECANQTASHTC